MKRLSKNKAERQRLAAVKRQLAPILAKLRAENDPLLRLIESHGERAEDVIAAMPPVLQALCAGDVRGARALLRQ